MVFQTSTLKREDKHTAHIHSKPQISHFYNGTVYKRLYTSFIVNGLTNMNL